MLINFLKLLVFYTVQNALKDGLTTTKGSVVVKNTLRDCHHVPFLQVQFRVMEVSLLVQ